jgi:DNA-binding SARP family transcriptional activator/ABC-type branched-subunit amino acid transport system substrate-binding protein/streptogramin lyase
LLLLARDEVVSSDRLIEDLWGGSPPADAQSALQAHVSRLRRLLEPEHGGAPQVLVTAAGGYALRIEPDQLDLNRFEAAVRDARRAFERGDASTTSTRLREALGFWRGRPLAGLEYEPYAADAIRQLDELRLEALETRIDADLALGRHAELTAELDGLVREHPLRERLRGQLMLALAGSGRQAEALEVYDRGRRMFAEELGMEPGASLQQLQARVLAGDVKAETPSARVEPTTPEGERQARPGRRWLALGLAGAALAAVAVAIVLLAQDDEGAPSPIEGTVFSLDAETGERTDAEVPIGGSPAAISAGEDGVWALDADGQTISRIDPGSGAVSTFGVGLTPIDLESGAGSLWVKAGQRVPGRQAAGPIGTALAQVDPTTSTVRDRIVIPTGGRALTTESDDQIAVEEDAVWTVAPDFSIIRIDPRTNRVVARVRGLETRAIAAGDAGVWALGADGSLAQVNRATNRLVKRTRIGASAVASVAVGGGSVWVTAPGDGTVWRVDPAARPALRTIDVGVGVTAADYGADGLWVANPLQGALSRIDPDTNEVAATAQIGGSPRALAVDGETVWAAVAPGGERPLLAEQGSSATRVHAGCEPTLFGGTGEPDALIVSDLPLQGGVRISAQQMVHAMALELRERDFRAGDLTIGYQSCDDSVGRTGFFDPAKCASNGRAYLRDERVLGIVGTLNSPCTVAMLPVLNGGPEAAPAMVSPFNSYIGLTRRAPGSPPGELESLYPDSERNFARVFPADDNQAAALAALADQRGERRAFTLDDGDVLYGGMLADRFARDARERGLEVVGHDEWDPRAPDYEELAARVARARPDVVFLGGTLDGNGAGVLSALGAELGRSTTFMVPDGFTPTTFLAKEAGPAAAHTYVSVAGTVTDDLPEAGQQFASQLSETLPGVPIEPSAVYTGAATQVLLDAIERSDSTRESVTEQVFATEIDDSAIGPVSFDSNGDIVSPAVTVLRIDPGARELPAFPDAVREGVIRP